MRIFIGIKFDDSTCRQIERFLKPFKEISSPVRWAKPGNVHLTLKFIGEVTAEQYARIDDALSAVQPDVPPLTLEIAGCGKFGRGSELNIFWLGIEKNPGLEKLFQTIEETLANIGISREERGFSPHITVGRNKQRFNFKPLLDLIDERAQAPVAEFYATSFQVYKSDLQPGGPVYTRLKEIVLGNS